jgi:hypothetical protein
MTVATSVTMRLTPEGERVRVTTHQEAVSGSKPNSPIESSDKMNGVMCGQVAAEGNANLTLRNDSANLPKSLALFTNRTTSIIDSRVHGEPYARARLTS